jgi:hypothetical protein
MTQNNLLVEMTLKEWDAIHRDFKSVSKNTEGIVTYFTISFIEGHPMGMKFVKIKK